MANWFAKMRGGANLARFARFSRDRDGATAVEFAFIAPILFAVLLATLQVAGIFLAQSYLATVADATARQVLTNNASGLTTTQFQTMICNNSIALFTNCSTNMIVSLQPAPTTSAGMASAMPAFDSTGRLKNAPTYASIPPCTKALLIVMYQWPVISGPLGAYFGTLGNGNYLLTATDVFQTEPPATGCS